MFSIRLTIITKLVNLMGRVPCGGIYVPGGGGGTPGAGTTVTCPSTSVPEVTTLAEPVGSFSEPRKNARMISSNLATNKKLWLLVGYDTNDTWIGDRMELYDPATGATSVVPLTQTIPEPVAVLPFGWGRYPNHNITFDYINNAVVYYEAYAPITSAYYILEDGTTDTLTNLYPNWSTPPINFTYALMFFHYANGLFVLPDNDNGNNQNAAFFSFADGNWYTLTFNATASDGPLELFNEDTRFMGTTPADTKSLVMVYNNTLQKVLNYFVITDAGGTPIEFAYTYDFNGEDPYATLDSTGNPYNLRVDGALLLNYAENATYDSSGNLTSEGSAAIMHGGFRLDASFNIIEDIWLQAFYDLKDVNTQVNTTNTVKFTDICTRASAASILATTYIEESSRGSLTYVPDTVDTTVKPETIYVQYFTGGVDPETSTVYDGTIWAIVTVLRNAEIAVPF